MTPQELIGAAERIKRIRAGVEKSQDIYGVPVRRDPTRMESIEAGNKVKRLMLDDERALVEYAIESLATVRADDDEPVTVEWVDAEANLGNTSESPYHRRYEIVPTIRLVADACPGGFHPCELWIGGGDSFTRRSVTRGQVRSLLRALGIEVKG